jgi:dual specificity MAP kinase phosphatase
VVIAYLMKLRGWRLAESYKWVKEKRRSIQITPGVSRALHRSC